MPADEDYEGLLAAYGSPLYVYDLARVRQAYADLAGSLPEGARVYYSLKANPHPGLVAELVRAGAHAEITSRGELASALEAGCAAGELLYSGPGKTAGELDEAVARGVRAFSAESFGDLERIGAAAVAHGATADCVLRVNAAGAPGDAGLRMTGSASQFGSDPEILLAAPERLRVPGARVVGLHFFPLTNARDEEGLVAEIVQSIRTAAELRDRLGLALRLVDLGGGFAAPYAVPGERPRYPGLRAAVTEALDTSLPGWRSGTPVIAFESGRHLVGDCGTLLTTVTDVKDSKGTRFAVLDAGVNHLGGLSGLGRLLPMKARPLGGDGGNGDNGGNDGSAAGEPERVTLAGPLCTPADLLGRAVELPGLGPGSVLAFPNVGAYGLTASLLGFLGHRAPAEVLIDGAEVVSASRLALHRHRITAAAKPEQRTGTGESDMSEQWDASYENLLKEVLPRLAEQDTVLPDTSLKSVGLDSLAMVEVLIRIEHEYALDIPDEDLVPGVFATPATLWTLIQRSRERSGSAA
ncbi:phosphopantetheine-binding protein [Streptomyces yaanensis]|uniref:Phosphopantetheine-binding protein n=1 Tax=Streptomyces yaanensis TaxID=1142239 RepID=A0ABV7SH00_9ACTN|nr:phosphopantetheine-binding protein [Streptomyces sp. CGMCC 4.7035]WNB99313.1 phosphopantetheine-binding protein [Streptomyces sp. CGMCC 4.7035]